MTNKHHSRSQTQTEEAMTGPPSCPSQMYSPPHWKEKQAEGEVRLVSVASGGLAGVRVRRESELEGSGNTM